MTAYTPNLPALPSILSLSKDALPGDHTRAPQESCAADINPSGCCPQCASPLPGAEPVPTSAEGVRFTRARQVQFLDNLSVTGSVRAAAASAQVSHQTAYRARRGQGRFRLAWDAAMLAARAQAEVTLAARAIDGVEEKVFYHGEEVATRIRYSDRLLLAHLARLDRLAESPGAAAVADDWDAALARFAAGEASLAEVGEPATEVPACAGTHHGDKYRAPAKAGASVGSSPTSEISSSGPCNTRSMSRPAEEDDDDLTDDFKLDDGTGREDEEEAEAELDRILAAMEAERPAGAPRLAAPGAQDDPGDPGGLIADAQFQAFEAGAPRWWLVVPPAPWGGDGPWHYADEEGALK